MALKQDLLSILFISALMTAINAAKPIHVDDVAYLKYAEEFAKHPMRPYGFMVGSPDAVSANHLLVPPVLPYWLAGGITLFGADETVLKLWQFPWVFLLAWCLMQMGKRFWPQVRHPVLWLCMFSPTLLPGFNLMLDLPAQALSLTIIWLTIQATEKQSWLNTIFACVMAAIALQTKYTCAVAVAAAIVWCLLQRQLLVAVLLGVLPTLAFIAWEYWIYKTEGESHFLWNLQQRQGKSLIRAIHHLLPLFAHVAGTMLVIICWAMHGLNLKSHTRRLFFFLMIGSSVLFCLLPTKMPLFQNSSNKAIVSISNIVMIGWGIPVWCIITLLWYRTLKEAKLKPVDDAKIDLFLVIWFFLELLGYFALSPFPAVRRIIGISLLVIFLAARRINAKPATWSKSMLITVFAVGYGFFFEVADYYDAKANRDVAIHVLQDLEEQKEPIPKWHLSWWGTHYYLQQQGCLPLQLNIHPPAIGDRLLVMDIPDLMGPLEAHQELQWKVVGKYEFAHPYPFRLLPGYYHGRIPIERIGESLFRFQLLELTAIRK